MIHMKINENILKQREQQLLNYSGGTKKKLIKNKKRKEIAILPSKLSKQNVFFYTRLSSYLLY